MTYKCPHDGTIPNRCESEKKQSGSLPITAPTLPLKRNLEFHPDGFDLGVEFNRVFAEFTPDTGLFVTAEGRD